MKICILTNSIREGYGGWARFSLEVIKELKKRKEIDLIVITEDGSGKLNIKKISDNFFYALWGLIYNIVYVRKATKNCQVIHAFDGYPYGIIAFLSSIGRKKQKLFISAIGTYSITPLKNLYFGWLLKKTYKNAQTIFAISHYTAQKLKSIINLNNIKVVHMGVNDALLRINQNDKEKISFLPKNYILTVGDLKPRKGYHISISALAKLHKKYPNLYYIIVGYQFNSNYFIQLKNLVKKYQIEKYVIFLSDISNLELKNLYQNATIFILPSINDDKHFEGFGLVYIEAGLFGIPAIGTNNCGAEDAIKNNQTGYLINQNNIDELVDKITVLLNNKQLRKKMGRQAREFAKNFKWSKTVDAYLKSYKT